MTLSSLLSYRLTQRDKAIWSAIAASDRLRDAMNRGEDVIIHIEALREATHRAAIAAAQVDDLQEVGAEP